MTCDLYRDHELGDLDSRAFAEHAEKCPACSRKVQQDADLTARIETMKQQPVHSPDLWHRIEASLHEERRRSASSGYRVRWQTAAMILFLIGATVIGAWRFDQLSFGPDRVTKTRTVVRTILPQVDQTLYMNFNRTDVRLSSDADDQVRMEADFVVTSASEDTVDAWLSRADILIRSYQDYVRFDLDSPIDTSGATSMKTSLRIIIPAGKTAFLGNTDRPIRIDRLVGALRISQARGVLEITESSGALTIEQSGEDLRIAGYEGQIDIASDYAALTVDDVTGTVRMTAAYAPVRMNGISGDIFVEAAGSRIELGRIPSFPPDRRIELTTSDSLMTITLPDTAQAYVESAASNGYITSDFPLYYTDESQSQAGLYLGEPRTRIRLVNNGGDIVIERSVPSADAQP